MMRRPTAQQWRHFGVYSFVVLGVIGLIPTGPAKAAQIPNHLVYKTSPEPIVAPSDVTFIVVTPKGSSSPPSIIRIHTGGHSEVKKFQRVAPHDFVATAPITATGTLKVQVLATNGTVLVNRVSQVQKAPAHWGTKIVIGGLFLLGSLYYWRRMQRFAPRS